MIDQGDLDHRFDYHPPSGTATAELHEAIRHELRGVAKRFNQKLPDGREKSLCITHLEEAMFWANAAIARNQPLTKRTVKVPARG